jgi:two-component system, OmpR family, phosphate regulon response regulator OmpR
MRILVIDDDRRLRDMLRTYLTGQGLEVETAGDARSGLTAVENLDPDAVVLDVMLPDLDGFEVCRRIRARSEVPVLMLTARGDETDRVVGLELGADDYLPKPFSPRELLARLRAITRRQRSAAAAGPDSADEVLRFGELEVDHGAHQARVAGEPRPLTSHQFEILSALARNAGRVLSRDQIMDAVRGESLEAFDRSIDVHVSRIRAAIEEDPKHPRRIVTVRGVGYVFTRDRS